MLFKKYFALVSLLATFSIAVPSPPEESEDLASYNIYINELKLVVHCYFNSDSPECKDEPADASDDPNATDVPDPAESETPEEKDNSNEANGKEFSYSSITMINRANETDMPPPKKYSKDDDFPEGLYEEVPDEINRYEEMEQFKVRWPERIYLRDNICLFCYAVLAEQEILNEPYRSRARKELGRREVTPFDATNKFFESAKRELGIAMDEPVPVERDHEFCSSIARQHIYKRSHELYKDTRSRKERGVLYRGMDKKLNFNLKLMINLKNDPKFLQCEKVDDDQLEQRKAAFRSVLGVKS